MWKKVLFLVMALSLFSTGVFAGTILKQYKTPRGNTAIVEQTDVHKGRVGLVVNGKTLKQETWYQDGVTYVPLRAVSEALGAKVIYDAKKWNADISLPKPQTKVVEKVVEKIVYVDSSQDVYDGKYYDVKYPKGSKADLELTKKYVDEGIALGKKLYGGQGIDYDKAMIDGKLEINVNLVTESNNLGAQDGGNRGQGSIDHMHTSIEVFAPSISIGNCCTNHGEKFEEAEFRVLVIHEVLHSFQMYHQELFWSKGTWFPHNQPSWLKEGMIEYFALKQANQLAPLRNNLKASAPKTPYNDTEYKFYTDKFDVSNPYTHGALFVNFLDETYGTASIFKYINSTKKTSVEAFKEVYGMDFAQAGVKFEAWRAKIK